MAKGKYQKWLTKQGLTLLKGWASDGLTDEQIAANMGLHVATLYKYKNEYNEINEALSAGKEIVDYAVECALQKRAEGYDVYEEEEVFDAETGQWVPVRRKKKHIAADVTAASMWLRNRRPDKWRDKPESVIIEQVESDGLFEALEKQIDESMEDDSWLIEGAEE